MCIHLLEKESGTCWMPGTAFQLSSSEIFHSCTNHLFYDFLRVNLKCASFHVFSITVLLVS